MHNVFVINLCNYIIPENICKRGGYVYVPKVLESFYPISSALYFSWFNLLCCIYRIVPSDSNNNELMISTHLLVIINSCVLYILFLIVMNSSLSTSIGTYKFNLLVRDSNPFNFLLFR